MDLENIIFDLDGGPPVRHILNEISGEERAEELGGSEAAFRESYDMEVEFSLPLTGGCRVPWRLSCRVCSANRMS